MTKRNEKMQRMAEQYWRKLESGGMAYELAPQTLVIGSFRDGLKSGLAAHRAEILKLKRENAALRKMLLDADVVAENERKDGRREWWSGGCWIPTRTMLILVDQPMFDEVQKKGRS